MAHYRAIVGPPAFAANIEQPRSYFVFLPPAWAALHYAPVTCLLLVGSILMGLALVGLQLHTGGAGKVIMIVGPRTWQGTRQ